MEKTKNRHLVTIFFCSLFLFLSAGEVHALLFHINAGNAGLKLHYNLKRWGSDNVTIAPGDPETQLTIKKIAGRLVQVWVKVDSIDTSTPVPVVNAVIKTFITGTTNTFPVAVPFGDYGIETNFFKRTRLKARNAPIEISLDFGILSTDYDITLNLGPTFNNHYKNSATLSNNVIHEKIPLPGDNMTANGSILDLTIIPVKTIPLTFFIYSGSVYDDNNTLVQSLSGMIPFPNGTYQLWMSPGFDIPDYFGPQACCLAETSTCNDITATMCVSAGGIPQGLATTCATVTCSSDNSTN